MPVKPLAKRQHVIDGMTMALVSLLILIVIVCYLSVVVKSVASVEPADRGMTIEVSYFIDDSAEQSFEQVRNAQSGWFVSKERNYTLGFTERVLWKKLTLINHTVSQQSIYYYLTDHLLDRIDIYWQASAAKPVEQYVYGDTMPFRDRLLPLTGYALPLTVSAKSKAELWVRLSGNSSLDASFNYLDPTKLDHLLLYQRTVYGFLLLILLSACLYGVRQYIRRRGALDALYACYSGLMLVLFMHMTGIGFALFWNNYPQLNSYFFPVLIGPIVLMTMGIIRGVLQQSSRVVFNRIMIGSIVALGFLPLFALLLFGILLSFKVSSLIIVVCTSLGIVLVVRELLAGNYVMIYLLLSWSLLMVGSSIWILNRILPLLPLDSDLVIFTGGALEVVLLAVVVNLQAEIEQRRQLPVKKRAVL